VANNATNPNTDVNFGSGVAWCNDRLIEHTSTRTKILSGTWAAGNNNGGRFSGVSLSASTWYHCFIMRNTSTNAIDFGFDTSVTGASKPSGWDVRLIWSIKTDASSNIIAFTQRGDICVWTSPPMDALWSYVATTSSLFAISSPAGLVCQAVVSMCFSDATANYLYISSPDAADEAADYTRGLIDNQGQAGVVNEKVVTTNTASQLRAVAAGTGPSFFSLATRHFVHPRGRR
jgi:hypothetical protein